MLKRLRSAPRLSRVLRKNLLSEWCRNHEVLDVSSARKFKLTHYRDSGYPHSTITLK